MARALGGGGELLIIDRLIGFPFVSRIPQLGAVLIENDAYVSSFIGHLSQRFALVL